MIISYVNDNLLYTCECIGGYIGSGHRRSECPRCAQLSKKKPEKKPYTESYNFLYYNFLYMRIYWVWAPRECPRYAILSIQKTLTKKPYTLNPEHRSVHKNMRVCIYIYILCVSVCVTHTHMCKHIFVGEFVL